MSADHASNGVAAAAAAPASAAAEAAPAPAAALPDASDDFLQAPRFQSLEWRLDVQRHSGAVSDMSVPEAIVQIRTRQGGSTAAATSSAAPTTGSSSGEQLLQFEVDRSTAAHVLLELERIEAIMASAQ